MTSHSPPSSRPKTYLSLGTLRCRRERGSDIPMPSFPGDKICIRTESGFLAAWLDGDHVWMFDWQALAVTCQAREESSWEENSHGLLPVGLYMEISYQLTWLDMRCQAYKHLAEWCRAKYADTVGRWIGRDSQVDYQLPMLKKIQLHNVVVSS